MNLLQETIDDLAKHDLTPSDVLWVGSRNGAYATTWDAFAKLADRDYDNDYGSAQVIGDLLVVGIDWWLERHEYDGSEWWEFKRIPTRNAEAKEVPRVFSEGYKTCMEDE